MKKSIYTWPEATQAFYLQEKEIVSSQPIPASFYEQNTVQVARELLGCFLVRKWQNKFLAGVIIETEAYCGELDPASHAYRGKTERNKAMFGPVGHSYVYFTYGMYHCLNLVAREPGMSAGGVLLRGLLPVYGIETMQDLRGVKDLKRLTAGPGCICQALQLNREHNHLNVTQHGELFVIKGITIPENALQVTPRIGISKAQDKLWRFVLSKPQWYGSIN